MLTPATIAYSSSIPPDYIADLQGKVFNGFTADEVIAASGSQLMAFTLSDLCFSLAQGTGGIRPFHAFDKSAWDYQQLEHTHSPNIRAEKMGPTSRRGPEKG